ncbi:3-oxoacyl-[acyl-carrier protein] reductase [Lentzea xinjiangensis]|uniref:3-oxoacyl-[acyl-carrier protein] reductase n=1 Tax=Lentzea xinjiangensis TaxID=402600 RepID=A0A1H9VBS5_9PSEU|nr:SDR family oxidoreductase [Lentzea xinjiangensis]SES19038.1 3-oxoacyl-[acyl-carrier protein] reductase [Lentzea xinjiangensis]
MGSLGGRAALVTGGSRGIRAAVAAKLTALGAHVAVTYQNTEPQGVKAIRADSSDPDAVVAAVEETAAEFGRLDVLVNNAAVFQVGPLEELGRDEFDHTMAVNVRAPFLAARAAVKHMRDGGRIISIGSNVAVHAPFPGFALYCASKTALVGMTKGLARDLGPLGITANVVNPGPTDTDMNPADGPLADTIRGLTALGRYGEPAEIAELVVALAGDAGAYVTGAVINADGGFTV